jgi:hypothetical protein
MDVEFEVEAAAVCQNGQLVMQMTGSVSAHTTQQVLLPKVERKMQTFVKSTLVCKPPPIADTPPAYETFSPIPGAPAPKKAKDMCLGKPDLDKNEEQCNAVGCCIYFNDKCIVDPAITEVNPEGLCHPNERPAAIDMPPVGTTPPPSYPFGRRRNLLQAPPGSSPEPKPSDLAMFQARAEKEANNLPPGVDHSYFCPCDFALCAC